jgi:Archaeal ATPase.
MLLNPFTPSEIARGQQNFFGRFEELRILERALNQGSIAIEGPIGIGKSSLLAMGLSRMSEVNSKNCSKYVIAVCNKDIQSIDDAARTLLESLVKVDEKTKKLKLMLPKIVEFESSEICSFFTKGRHMAVIKRLVEKEYSRKYLSNDEMLIIAIDEADKSPKHLAGMIRDIITYTQQKGINKIRFIVAGVSPFFQKMIDEDQGIRRFFYKNIFLHSMLEDDSYNLLTTKLEMVIKDAKKKGINIQVEERAVDRIVKLSGGHPHILQLLGSHMVENENNDPDGILDYHDLLESLHTICYEDRAKVYDSIISNLELNNKIDAFKKLLGIASKGFPTIIDLEAALNIVPIEAIKWFTENNILYSLSSSDYGLVDEFLRIRIMLDEADTPTQEAEIERNVIERGVSIVSLDSDFDEDERY